MVRARIGKPIVIILTNRVSSLYWQIPRPTINTPAMNSIDYWIAASIIHFAWGSAQRSASLITRAITIYIIVGPYLNYCDNYLAGLTIAHKWCKESECTLHFPSKCFISLALSTWNLDKYFYTPQTSNPCSTNRRRITTRYSFARDSFRICI